MKVTLQKHNSDTQLTYGGHGYADTRKHLEEGTEYDAVIDRHEWHTYVCIDGRGYNSVCFEFAEKDDADINGPDGLPKTLQAIIVDELNVFVCRIGTLPRTTDRGIANVIPCGVDRDGRDRAIAITKRLVDGWNRTLEGEQEHD